MSDAAVNGSSKISSAGTYDSHKSRTQSFTDMPAEIREVYITYRDPLFYKILGIVQNKEDAEEIYQDTFICATRGYAKFRGDSSVRTWIYRIGVNLAINRRAYWNRRARGRTLSLDAQVEDSTSDDATLVNSISYKTTPYCFTQAVEANELIARSRASLNKLSNEHRQILSLKIKGLSYQEMSNELKIGLGTVKSRLARARDNMAKILYGPQIKRKNLNVIEKKRNY